MATTGAEPSSVAMSPEAVWALALARGDVALARLEGGRGRDDAGRRVDPERLRRLLEDQQVDALAYGVCRGAEGLPDGVRRALDACRPAFLHHSLRNEALARDLARLQHAFRARELDVLVLKGPWLALHAYPEPGQRPVDDIDLCVRERDYASAVEALTSLGYVADRTLPPDGRSALRRAHFGAQLRFRASGRRPIELHFRLVNCGRPRAEGWVWETARELVLGDVVVWVPGSTAMLLHLALHANQHGFAVLRILHDIRAELALEADRIDVAELRRRALELGCVASVYYALVLARDLAGAGGTEDLLDALRPSAARRAWFERVWAVRAARELRTRRRPMRVEAPRLALLELGGPWEKLRYAFGVAREALACPASVR